MNHLKQLVKKLVGFSAPSGYEHPIRSFVKERYNNNTDITIEEDRLGNLLLKKDASSDKTIMLIAHCDEIGFAVKYIDEGGQIYFAPFAGIEVSILKGSMVTICHHDKLINGVIGVKPLHLIKGPRNSKDLDISDLWIDIGVNSRQDANKIVSIGDPITFKPNYIDMPNNIFSAKSIDNRIGVAVILSVLDNLSNNSLCNIVCVLSVQEELGLRGATTAAYNINPDICIAVDVTHATDYPSISKNQCGDIRINAGPVIPIGANFNYRLQQSLREIAEKSNIAYQIEATPGYSGTDAAEAQLSRGGCMSGLISVPCRYMHTPVEMASYSDADSAVDILTRFCFSNNNII